tara:strand:+ start:3046 stop:4206 length:1161 start_codon:yes stop_codon:yes gene_type:complete
MNTRKTLIIISSLIVIALFALTSYISYNFGMNYGVENAELIREQRASESEKHSKNIKSVLATKVVNKEITNQIYSTGRVLSVNSITISSEVQGKILNNSFLKKGTKIKKGNNILNVQNTDLQLLLNAKKSRLMSLISSNLADIELDFNGEYEKWKTFFNKITLNNNLPDFPKLYSTKEKNFIISRSILSEYLSIKSDEEKLKKYIIKAPFDGIITRSYTDIGAFINPGSPIIDFIRDGEMEIELSVNTSEIDLINLNDSVVLSNSNNVFSGKIVRKSEFVNNNTQNISVFASVKNAENSLYSGMYLDAKIINKSNEKLVKIPRRAVFNENKVFTIDRENKLEIKTLNIISYQDDFVVVDNLKNGTIVVKEPLIGESEGTKVKVILK